MLDRIQNRDAALRHEIVERARAENELQALHAQLLDASRQAGMAEVATGVLHNVGNVLNSVNVSASIIAQTIHATKASRIKKASDLLAANRDDLPGFFGPDGKGAVFVEYLAALSSQLENERASQLAELELLTRNITHIKKIVAMQQNHAKAGSLLETLSARELAVEAIQLTARELTQHSVKSEV